MTCHPATISGDLLVVWPDRHPNDAREYTIDGWLAYLEPGEVVLSATWSVSPSGVALSGGTVSADGDKTSLRVSGGAAGTFYFHTCSAIVTGGRVLNRVARQYVSPA